MIIVEGRVGNELRTAVAFLEPMTSYYCPRSPFWALEKRTRSGFFSTSSKTCPACLLICSDTFVELYTSRHTYTQSHSYLLKTNSLQTSLRNRSSLSAVQRPFIFTFDRLGKLQNMCQPPSPNCVSIHMLRFTLHLN